MPAATTSAATTISKSNTNKVTAYIVGPIAAVTAAFGTAITTITTTTTTNSVIAITTTGLLQQLQRL